MTHELYPEYFTYDPELFILKEKLIKAADHIIAVSENTKNDIISILDIDPQKISVVYHASELLPAEEKNELINELPKRYLLYVGDRNGYKNFWFFIHSIKDLFRKYNDLELICTGVPFSLNEIKLFKALGINDRIRCLFFDETSLFSLYKKAEAFVFPSLNEGFGIPILEAFQSGCPALLSNKSCFPEIAGEAAIYFDPRNRNEISNTIEEVLNNQQLRESLIKEGKERLKYFSWKKSSEKTLDVYKKLIE
jgi:glycosyltransferase involved in cell wall biosynthesis